MTARRPTPLTKQAIFETALGILDAEGAENLSMRRLAKELGVEAMSLYHHVPNKQAVLAGAVEVALTSQQASPPESPSDWKDTVLAAVCGFRRALTTHPAILPLIVATPPSSPEANAMYIEMPLRFLVAQGFDDRDAGQLFEAVFALSFGHAMLTTSYKTIGGEDGVPRVEFAEESFERSVRVLLDGYEAARD